ncbi:unnamed protein product [Ilex paraguariensis]|uniref:Uncharacterized protein n=1 Tax=Ilex paraguariensis TaxID=185542 RepID=A0ABC8TVR7_9AQUA
MVLVLSPYATPHLDPGIGERLWYSVQYRSPGNKDSISVGKGYGIQFSTVVQVTKTQLVLGKAMVFSSVP